MVSSPDVYAVTEPRTHFHLFVYGTLRRGQPNAAMLNACEYIGEGSVGGVLYNIDNKHPALVLYGTAPITGEVWRCPNAMLSTLDQFEGVDDGLYRRVGVEVTLTQTNDVVPSWIYTAGPALARKLVPSQRIHSWPV